MGYSKKFLVDIAERTASTYIEVFTGLLIASKVTLDLSVLKTSAIAAIPAGLAVLKGLIAKGAGDTNSAAIVAVAPPVPLPPPAVVANP